MAQTEVVAGGRLTDWISLGVLATWVPADAVDEAVEAAGTLADWDGWEESWGPVPASGGITQARQRLGPEPMEELFSQVARPVATMETAGAFLGRWRLMSIDGMAWDIPDTPANAAAFGYPRAGKDGAPGAFPKAQLVTVSECASHAAVLAAIGPFALKAGGERALARRLYPKLEEDWLLIADRGFYDWQDWCAAADTGAALPWRFKSGIRLPVLEILPDGSCRSVLVTPKAKAAARQELIEAARAREDLDPAKARHVRVVEYEIPDRDGEDELIALVTTITGPPEAPAAVLAAAAERVTLPLPDPSDPAAAIAGLPTLAAITGPGGHDDDEVTAPDPVPPDPRDEDDDEEIFDVPEGDDFYDDAFGVIE